MRPIRSTRVIWGLIGYAAFILPVAAIAQTNSWIDLGSSFWDVPTSWSLGVPPSSNQAAIFITNTNFKTVFMDRATATNTSALTISNLTVSGSSGATNTLQIAMDDPSATLHILNSFILGNGGTVVITNSSLQVDGLPSGGFKSDGNVIITAGTLSARDITVGDSSGSQGSLALAGGNAKVDVRLLIGQNGVGAVWIDGGQLTLTNVLTAVGFLGYGQMTLSNGTVTAGDVTVGNYTQDVSAAVSQLTVVNGQLVAGNKYAIVGCSGAGQMSVAGGTVELKSPLMVGTDKGTGTVWVTGGNLATTNDAFIGSSGTGQMTVSNGTFAANAVYVGSDPFFISGPVGPSGVATGVVAGGVSQGTLTAAGGTITLNSSLLVGTDSGATGVVWATGGEIVATNDTTAIGYAGIGRMTVSNGTVQTRGMFVGQLGGSQGTLTMAGGVLIALGDVVVGDCATNAMGQVNVNGGDMFVINASHTATLDVRNGTLVLNAGLLLVDRLVLTNACGQIVQNGGLLIYDNLVLDPALDADGDGLPNGWELANGLDPLSGTGGNGAAGDPDQDGLSNAQEYQLGTVPTVDIKSIVREGNNIRVTWTAMSGKTNALQYAADIGGSSNNFVDLFVVTNSTGSATNYLDVGALMNLPSRFYRVRLVP
jgi:hypothetical protein